MEEEQAEDDFGTVLTRFEKQNWKNTFFLHFLKFPHLHLYVIHWFFSFCRFLTADAETQQVIFSVFSFQDKIYFSTTSYGIWSHCFWPISKWTIDQSIFAGLRPVWLGTSWVPPAWVLWWGQGQDWWDWSSFSRECPGVFFAFTKRLLFLKVCFY